MTLQPAQPVDGFSWLRMAEGDALVCEPLRAVADHLFTTRAWKLGSAADGTAADAWRQVADAFAIDPANLTRARQVHGADLLVRRAGRDGAPSRRHEALVPADIIISDDPATVLAIQTADCVPLLIADRRTGSAAAAHAGWRGLAAGVPGVAVGALADALGSRPADLVVAIGPSISGPRYEVGVDVRARFAAAAFPAARVERWFSAGRSDHWYFDGWQSAIDQLEAAGVPRSQIHLAGLCTAGSPQLCSYRRDGARAGRMAAAIRPGRD
jgi:purine-nucleoside/S-methyl-5'-thioadenosine phosphorylase / adenosine deaminase